MGVTIVKAWDSIIDKARKKTHQSANQVVRARVKTVFEKALQVSPQWSGNYASNWAIETNTNGVVGVISTLKLERWKDLEWWDTGKETKAPKNPSGKPLAKSAGDKTAINLAKTGGAYEAIYGFAGTKNHKDLGDELGGIKWNSKVKLVNRTPITADALEAGSVNLRNVNLVAGKDGVIAFLKSKYPYFLNRA